MGCVIFRPGGMTVSTQSLVIVEDPPNMNLLGLLLGSILERQAEKPASQKRLAKLKGTVVVEVGQMAISLAFAKGQVTISRGAATKPRARIRGSMDTLMNISLGRGMVGPWLRGRIKTRGNLPMLLRMLPLMRIG